MLNFFKNLFGSGETDAPSNGHGYAAAAPAAPVQAAPRQATDARSQSPVSKAPAAFSPRSFGDQGGGVQIPLHTVIAVLPLEMKTRIKETMVSDLLITVPLDRVLTQLGGGAVRISFGELRNMAPGVFSPQNDLDAREISLPLNEILPQINPGLLARRQSQRQVQVPEDVRGPFGGDCTGVSFAETRTATTTTPEVPEMPIPRETKQPPTPAMRPVPPARPAAPAPAAPITPTPLADAPIIPFRASITSTPTPRPPTATPPANPPVRPAFPAAPRGVGATPSQPPTSIPTPRMPAAGNGNKIPTPTPAISMAPKAPAAPAVPMAARVPAAPATGGPDVFLTVPLAALSDGWPEVLRNEIEQLHLSSAQLALPVKYVEPALKQGKVAFPWKVIRSWVRPATLPTVSAHDGMLLELPLRVLAPLFVTRHKQGASQKVQIDEKIPNLFFGFPQPESAPVEPPPVAPAAPRAPSPAEQAGAIFTPAPKQAGIPDTNFYVWGENGEAPKVDETEFKRKAPSVHTDFLSRYATPNEVVSRAAALEGVAGALVALPDGLMVASKLSNDLNGDTLAAFLPQIFGKVSQCTKELRMGELNNLHFTVGNVPWKIFRVNAIFFAAFGHAGCPLPTGQLAGLAAELDRKK